MKKLYLMVLSIVMIISVNAIVFAADNQPAFQVIVYYFHGSFRCQTCANMEKYSKEAIDTNFKDTLASGKIEFRVVNVEERGNEYFVNKYQLYTKSLILSFVKDGKEIRHKNLDKIWEYVRNKESFIDYVTSEINNFIKDAQ